MSEGFSTFNPSTAQPEKPKNDVGIEKDIPIPPQARRSNTTKYPFASMVQGDSFAIPTMDDPGKRVSGRIRSALLSYQRRTGDKARFHIRILNEEVRCWKLTNSE